MLLAEEENSTMVESKVNDHASQESRGSSTKSQRSPIEVITVNSNSSAVTGITATSQVSQRTRQQNMVAKQKNVNQVSSKATMKSQVEAETVISHTSGETDITTASQISRRMRQQHQSVPKRQATRRKQQQAKAKIQTGDQRMPKPSVHPDIVTSFQKSRGNINTHQVNMPSPILSPDETTSANAT